MAKFIVFEGLDGSGKSTQANLLEEKLRDDGYKVKSIHFPRTQDENAVFAGMIQDYLKGDYGEFVSPYFIASLYANDRYMFSGTLAEWINFGDIDYIIADRYMYSAMAYQGAKFDNESTDNFITDRERFFDWLWNYEFKQNQIPKPDLVLLIDVSVDIIRERFKNKDKDIHEKDFYYLREVRDTYLEIQDIHNKLINLIDCDNCGNNAKEINNEIVEVLKREELY